MRFSTATNPFTHGGPLHAEACGCRFKGGSQSTANTSNTDNKVAAGDSSVFATGGSTVNADISIESLDADVAKSALENMTATAGAGFSANIATVDRALSFGESALSAANVSNRETLAASDKAIATASEAFKAAQSGSAGQLQDTLKQIAIAGFVTVGAVAAVYFLKRK